MLMFGAHLDYSVCARPMVVSNITNKVSSLPVFQASNVAQTSALVPISCDGS